MAHPRLSIFSKKVVSFNTENSVEIGLFVTLLIHLVLFVIANQLFYSDKFSL